MSALIIGGRAVVLRIAGDLDLDDEVEVEMFDRIFPDSTIGATSYLNKDEAKALIDHLITVFSLEDEE